MKWTYSCPACGAMLNPGESIILIGVQDDRRTLLAFNPEPGDYHMHAPPHTAMAPGTMWTFLCPLCQKDLVLPDYDKMCALDLLEGTAKRRVFFSRVAGEHATVVLADKQVTGYGEHAPSHMQYFLKMKHLL